MSYLKPKKGAVAKCGLGCLGLITSNEPLPRREDGKQVWQGIHLEDREVTYPNGEVKRVKEGDFWCSAKPQVLVYLVEYV